MLVFTLSAAATTTTTAATAAAVVAVVVVVDVLLDPFWTLVFILPHTGCK